MPPALRPPIAKKTPKEITVHGHTRTDDYFWMRERDNPEIINHLNEENAFAETQLQPVKQLQEDLFLEMKARIRQTDMSVPYKLDSFLYYARFEEGKEYPFHCRKNADGTGDEKIILNVNLLSEGKEYCSTTGLKVSRSHSLLAWGEDFSGRRLYTLRIKELESEKVFSEEIPGTSGEYAWANDEKTLFYVKRDEETLRPFAVMRHCLGENPSKDVCVFSEPDEAFYVTLSKTKSRKFIVISSNATDVSEDRILNASDPSGHFILFHPREDGHEYSIDHSENTFYILTNLLAENFRLMTCGEENTSKAEWKELIPHRPEILLEEIEVFRDFLVLAERVRGLSELHVLNIHTKEDHYISFSDKAYTASIDLNIESDTKILRFGYNSLTTPYSVFDYDLETRESTLLKREEVLGGFDPANYESDRFFVNAADGREVPVSLVYKKGFPLDGNRPVYLTAYGSYGSTYDPYFSSVRLCLLDRGFAYAIAHVRGGQEMGRYWYEEGRMLNKQNTFTDFIFAAQELIRRKYTSSEKLVINGGSAGGMLVGAVINMAPQLFKIAVADVPFVDVINTMLDASIPLTVGEYTEWGNPEEKEYYHYMLGYSPYDNVRKQDYPHLLVTASYHDSQVQYWEPAKWVAKLREMKTDNNLLLFQTDMSSGHSGKSGRFDRLRLIATEYSFVMMVLGMVK